MIENRFTCSYSASTYFTIDISELQAFVSSIEMNISDLRRTFAELAQHEREFRVLLNLGLTNWLVTDFFSKYYELEEKIRKADSYREAKNRFPNSIIIHEEVLEKYASTHGFRIMDLWTSNIPLSVTHLKKYKAFLAYHTFQEVTYTKKGKTLLLTTMLQTLGKNELKNGTVSIRGEIYRRKKETVLVHSDFPYFLIPSSDDAFEQLLCRSSEKRQRTRRKERNKMKEHLSQLFRVVGINTLVMQEYSLDFLVQARNLMYKTHEIYTNYYPRYIFVPYGEYYVVFNT